MALTIAEPWARTFLVTDPFGQPVAGAGATMMLYEGRSGIGTFREEQTDNAGMVSFGMLNGGSETVFTFQKEGFINGISERIGSLSGEDRPVEPFVLYQGTNLVARLIDSAGEPIDNAAVQCIAVYGDGRDTTIEGATNDDGWIQYEGTLPSATAELTFHIEAAPGSPQAEGLRVRIEGAELAPESENDLGDIVLSTVAD